THSYHHYLPSFPNDALPISTGLPVIAITKTRLRLRHNYTLEKKNKIIYASSQLNPETIKQVIHLSWTIDDLPEPVRIAHLLVNSISSRPVSRYRIRTPPAITESN